MFSYPLTIMRFHPTITFEQYRDTCRAIAAVKPKSVRKRSWREIAFVCLLSLTAGVAVQVPDTRIPTATGYVMLLLLWVISKPLTKRSQERCFRALYAEEQEALNSQVLTIDESGIESEAVDGQSTSRHTWKAFVKRIDMADAYVFLPSPNSFIRVPKAMLESDLELVWHWSSSVPTA